jgi:hypothetical protein
MRYRNLWVVLAVLSVSSPAAAESRIVSSAMGCQTRETFDKLVKFQFDGDKEAFTKFATANILTGQCVPLSVGDSVFLEDVKMFSGVVCVRPRGATACYWTFTEAVK